MDHAPDRLPARQVPLTAVRTAFSKRSTNDASTSRSTPAVQVPEYSPRRPAMTARQAPLHRPGAFAADHPPLATCLPCASASAHVPVTVPLVESGTAVQVPISVTPLLVLALHVPERLLWALRAVSWRIPACPPAAPTADRSSRADVSTRTLGRVIAVKVDGQRGTQ
jgi:hypothetical protein